MKISICIPIYNAEKYLPLAIQSVLNQTYRSFELILINDGSKDGSKNIIEKFAQNDDRIKVVDDGVNKGLIARLNESIEMSQGVYYARMDADDVMFPERIEKQLQFMEQHPNVDLCYSQAVSIDSNNEIIGLRAKGIIHPTVFAKRNFYLENKYANGFHQMEDAELWYRTKEKYCFAQIEEPLLFYREDSTPNSKKRGGKKKYVAILNFANKYAFSTLKTIKLLFLNYVKYLFYLLFETLGIEHYILRKRYLNIDNSQKKEFSILLKAINGSISTDI
jgi:glycosyltransferase involved in cell wall biosynthesis